jgi:hypothetical protein
LAHDAVHTARRVVGFYGDPTVSWSILLEARLTEPSDPDQVTDRLSDAAQRYPHLGEPPAVRLVSPSGWAAVHADFADRPYGDSEPLVRVAAGADRLLIATHHGAMDGLGLLSLLGIALGVPIASSARGIGARPAVRGFLTSCVLRLLEALFVPPSRAAPSCQDTPPASPESIGDALTSVDLPASRVGSAALTAATARAVRAWNQRHGVTTPRVVAALGASRQPGDTLTPDLCAAFYRLRVPSGANTATVRRLLDRTAPEPDFPSTGSTFARPVIQMLTNRLGATFLASNLGVVRTDRSVRSLAFHPVASGRAGIAVGAVTCADTTTVTVRARRTSFDDAAATDILRLVVDGLAQELAGAGSDRSG